MELFFALLRNYESSNVIPVSLLVSLENAYLYTLTEHNGIFSEGAFVFFRLKKRQWSQGCHSRFWQISKTFSQPGEADYAHHITTGTPTFSDWIEKEEQKLHRNKEETKKTEKTQIHNLKLVFHSKAWSIWMTFWKYLLFAFFSKSLFKCIYNGGIVSHFKLRSNT